MKLSDLTDKQLDRLSRKAWDRIMSVFAGGLQYGLDWPTLAAAAPGWYNTAMILRNEYRRRR